VEPRRISFVGALRAIRDELAGCPLESPGAIPQRLRKMRQRIAEEILPSRRTERRYPRDVKIKMSNYLKKHRAPEPAMQKPNGADHCGAIGRNDRATSQLTGIAPSLCVSAAIMADPFVHHEGAWQAAFEDGLPRHRFLLSGTSR
jgi:hypothetical protein